MRHLYYKSITCGSEIISEEGEERIYELKAMNNYKKKHGLQTQKDSCTYEFIPVVLARTTPE